MSKFLYPNIELYSCTLTFAQRQPPNGWRKPCVLQDTGGADWQDSLYYGTKLRKTVLVSKSLDNRVLYRDESKTGLLSTDDSAAAETAL